MFPREVQPILDDWIAGKLSEAQFSTKRLARGLAVRPGALHGHFPLRTGACHPDAGAQRRPALIRAVSRDGLQATPAVLREGVGDPAPPSAAYRHWLAAVMAEHSPGKQVDEGRSARFVQAQQVWDRAMAEGLAVAARSRPGSLTVGVMGTGHIIHGFGVPHQLRDLGIDSIAAAIPWDADTSCRDASAARPTSSSPFANCDRLARRLIAPLPRPLSDLLLPAAGWQSPRLRRPASIEAPVAMALAISLDPQSRQLAGCELTIQESGETGLVLAAGLATTRVT